MIAQLKKGVLEFCILHIISKDTLYGYEIMNTITSIFTDTNEATVYSILRRLLSDDYTECYSQSSTNGPPRKYYKITIKGRQYLEKSFSDWKFICNSVEKIIEEK